MSITGLQSHEFMRYFLSVLVLNKQVAYDIQDRSDQRAVRRLYEFVSSFATAAKAKEAEMHSLYRNLIRIRNNIAPSHIGSFDGFETMLRDQQNWLTSSKNPDLDILKFDLQETRAENLLSELDESSYQFFIKAAEAYLGKNTIIEAKRKANNG